MQGSIADELRAILRHLEETELAGTSDPGKREADRYYGMGFIAGWFACNAERPCIKGEGDAQQVGPQGDNRAAKTTKKRKDDGLGEREQ